MKQFLPYHTASRQAAREIVARLPTGDLEGRWNAITKYVDTMFGYDYIRAITVPKKNGYPDVDRCWKNRMGICMDIAAMTAGMLKAAGVPAKLVIGKANRQPHAWVEADIHGRTLRYDHRRKGDGIVYKGERRY